MIHVGPKSEKGESQAARMVGQLCQRVAPQESSMTWPHVLRRVTKCLFCSAIHPLASMNLLPFPGPRSLCSFRTATGRRRLSFGHRFRSFFVHLSHRVQCLFFDVRVCHLGTDGCHKRCVRIIGVVCQYFFLQYKPLTPLAPIAFVAHARLGYHDLREPLHFSVAWSF